MQLFYTEIPSREPSADEARAVIPPQRLRGRPNRGSFAAYALAQQVCGCSILSEDGRPRPSAGPLSISLSHTKTHVLCAVSDSDCGCDIELIRPLQPAVLRRVLSASEQAELNCPEDFFRFWCLKESFYKYTGGSASLSGACFTLKPRPAFAADPGLSCSVFDSIPGLICAAVGKSAAKPPIHLPNDLVFERLWKL